MITKQQEREYSLLQAAISGNEGAFNRMYQQHHNDLKGYIVTLLESTKAFSYVDDIEQEVWIRVLKYGQTYAMQEDGSVHSWLFQIARHQVADQLKELDEDLLLFPTSYERHDGHKFGNEIEELSDALDGQTQSPEELLEKKQELLSFISELSDQERQVFTLFSEGYTYDEISTQTDLSINAVDLTIRRIRAKTDGISQK